MNNPRFPIRQSIPHSLFRTSWCLLLAAVLGACSSSLQVTPPVRLDPVSTMPPALKKDTVTAPKPALPPITELARDSLLSPFDGTSFPRLASFWVDSVMTVLSLRDRVAQLITVYSASDDSPSSMTALRRQLRDLPVGGMLLSRGTIRAVRAIVDSLRAWSPVPVLLSADFETGAGMRLTDAQSLPPMMALGAVGDVDLAYEAGRAIAREARVMGIRQIYAPVVDVNTNPRNPIINVRSFGEDPAAVAALAEAFSRGMQDERVLATAKHFPGHGDTHLDSHSDLPILSFSRSRLDSVELLPFHRLIRSGILSVMTGHLAVPAWDPDSSRPASLSRAVTDSLLRGALAFRGLIVTDAMNMQAVTRQYGSGRAAVRALLAGADVVLMPDSPRAAVDSIVAAVERGELSRERLDRSVRRLLMNKEWLGRASSPSTDSLGLASRAVREIASEIARKAVTLVRNDSAALPLRLRDHDRLGVFVLATPSRADEARAFMDSLRAAHPRLTELTVIRGKENGTRVKELMDSIVRSRRVLLVSFIGVTNGSGSAGFSPKQRQMAEAVLTRHPAAVLVSFGSPYVLSELPSARGFLCAYGDDPASRQAGLAVLLGQASPLGNLPVTIPELAKRGTGLRYISERLSTSSRFDFVDSLINQQIQNHAFPGAQLAVVSKGKVVHARAFGRLSYDMDAAPVTDSTRFDLASVSKVLATTSLAMRMYERGALPLDSPVVHWIPGFGRNGKSRITVRNLLLHNSGLPPFIPFHRVFSTALQVKDSIDACPLDYPTGTRSVYSDLGMITLGRILECIGGTSLDSLATREVFTPLGMVHTGYRPPESLIPLCAPTEEDHEWRKRRVQGSVHDETAALLDGVAGHAGVFSTADDCARFALMMLDSGRTDAGRYFRPSTITYFTTRAPGAGSRALGWDTRSTQGSSAGRYFSSLSYGHTGFTGTSLWIDPASDLAVIFLTNRVHPTRENKKLLPFRAVLHDAVRRTLSREQ